MSWAWVMVWPRVTNLAIWARHSISVVCCKLEWMLFIVIWMNAAMPGKATSKVESNMVHSQPSWQSFLNGSFGGLPASMASMDRTSPSVVWQLAWTALHHATKWLLATLRYLSVPWHGASMFCLPWTSWWFFWNCLSLVAWSLEIVNAMLWPWRRCGLMPTWCIRWPFLWTSNGFNMVEPRLSGWTRMSPGTTLACQHNPCLENKPMAAWSLAMGSWPLASMAL